MNTRAQTNAFNHKPGDGLHYITDNFRILENGDVSYGETSEGCCILNAHVLCSVFELPPFWELWNKIYPKDPMSMDDAATIIDGALKFTELCEPQIPDNTTAVLEDLESVGYPEFAEAIRSELCKRGINTS
jgi:hypothetical protein